MFCYWNRTPNAPNNIYLSEMRHRVGKQNKYQSMNVMRNTELRSKVEH